MKNLLKHGVVLVVITFTLLQIVLLIITHSEIGGQ